jgi:NitT/TauT family transport system ATP-binding protein
MIQIKHCYKHYPDPRTGLPVKVLDDLNLAIEHGEFVCLVGPSGCGKTTLLKILAGLLKWDTGEVLIDGRPVSGPGPERSLVFQDFALLPWADVLANVAFGLELQGVPKVERSGRAQALIESVGLTGFEHHYPRQLSGGMQQRVGLARALATNPKILLMDEPFGSVDALTRHVLQEDLLQLYQRDQKTVVFVTHSVDEAVLLGDRIVLLSQLPTQVVELVNVSLPRPRLPEVVKDPAFVELQTYLWDRLKQIGGSVNLK